MSGCKCMTPRPTQIHHNRIKQLEAELATAKGYGHWQTIEVDKLRDTVTLSADRNTELEAEVEDLENKLATGVHTCSSTCKRPMCVLRKERNKLREALQEIADGKHHGLDKIGSPAFARNTLFQAFCTP
jgi:hypothetical protein